MIDLNHATAPDFVERMKGRVDKTPDLVGVYSSQVKRLKTEIQTAQEAKNAATKNVTAAYAAGDEETARVWRDKTEIYSRDISRLKPLLEEMERFFKESLLLYPNIPADDVPYGRDEHDNVEIKRHGTVPNIAHPLDHVEIGRRLDGMDFQNTVKVSGARHVTLHGPLAKLERVLGQFMLDHHVECGWRETAPPLIVNHEAMVGTGQLPKFGDDCYRDKDKYFIPTSEVSLTNLVRDSILSSPDIRMVALTPCFRKEAGSAGRDTKGMIRLHQFNKVEMVSIVEPERSELRHMEMVMAAESILALLGLPYRRVLLCSNDMGFSSQKTYDLEVWMPSQQTYREISSISNCGDFQARRMMARYKNPGMKKPAFVHTLNGSGVAVGRALVAVLENYQDDSGVTIPDALVARMGCRRIDFVK